MSKNNVIIIAFSIIIVIILAITSYGIYSFLTAPVLSNKTETVICIDEGDVIDGAAMIDPPEKYSELLKIEESTRIELGNYMTENKYRLKSGTQEFYCFLSFDEMIKYEIFKFMPLE